ncbi:MAG: ABC transporter, partial [Anaerolineaceae bacterium]|nr:ABC transporter [Anaerolineaceae bacterium]
SSGSIAVGIILGSYFISIIAGMNENFEFLKHFTPFYYYDAGEIFRTGQLNTTYVCVSVAIIVVCLIVAYSVYNQRDLNM